MYFRWVLCSLLLLGASTSFGQDYSVKKLSFITGSTSAFYDKVLADGFGGCFVAGRRNNGGTKTTVLQRYDSTGAVVWTKNLSLPAEGKCIKIIRAVNDVVFIVAYTDPSFGQRMWVSRRALNTGALVWEKLSNFNPKAAAISGLGTTARLVVVGNYPHVSNPGQTRYTFQDFKVNTGDTTQIGSDPTSDNTSFEDVVWNNGDFRIACRRNGYLQMAVLDNVDGDDVGFGVGSSLPGTYTGPRIVRLSGGDIAIAARRVNDGFGSGYFLRIQGIGTRVYEVSAGAPNADFADLKAISFDRMIALGKTGSPTSVGQIYRIQPDGVAVIQEYARTTGTLYPRAFWVDEIETVHVTHAMHTAGTLITWGMGSATTSGWKHSFLWNYDDTEPYAMDATPADGTMFVVGRRDYGGIDIGFLAKMVAIPDSRSDAYEMRTGTTWVENGYGAQLNDFGITGATTTYTRQALHGTFSPALAGGFTYVPDAGYAGSDSVRYKLSRDGLEGPETFINLYVQPEITAIDAPIIHGGRDATLTIQFNGNRLRNNGVVYLADNSAQTTMPESVTIPVGQSSKSFVLSTTQELVDRTVTIFAQIAFPNSTQTFTKTLTIKGLSLKEFYLANASVVGGQPISGTVILSSQSISGTTVNITHSGTDVATPISVTIQPNWVSQSFDGATSVTSTNVTRTITATFNGVSIAKELTLTPGGLYGLTLTPNSVKGGTSTQGKLQTAGLAPAGGTTALLSAPGGNVVVPASATVPQGAQYGTFPVNTTSVTTTQTRTLSAQWGTITKTATLTITP